MRLIKIGIGSVNPTVGALRANTDKVIALAEQMAVEQCTVGCFAEQAISGYPAEDLVQWKDFVAIQWHELERFAKAAESWRAFQPVFVVGVTVEESGNLYNSAAILCGGKILALVPKEKLPTYGVFYERRTFSAGIPGRVMEVHGVPFGDLIIEFPFGTIAVEVCEDIWSPDGPMRRRAYSGAELIVNISASPWRAGVVGTRREMIATRAADNVATVVYVNQVGGNDSLAFDGGGFVNQGGRLVLEAPRWREGLAVATVDLDRTTRLRRENTTWRSDCEIFFRTERAVQAIGPAVGPEANLPGYAYPAPASKNFVLPPDVTPNNPRQEYLDDLIEAMITGLKGYFEKTGAFRRIGIALSGGKDSALTLVITWMYAKRRFGEREELIKDFIHCFSMPTRFNSETTKQIARELCEELGVTFTEVPIEEQVNAGLALLMQMYGKGEEIPKIARQNLQARIRGSAMWNWTNAAEAMWLQTGNMSEKAVGYTTIGGDLMGAYSLLGNLPKTVVIELLHHVRERVQSRALAKVLKTKASAELEPNQEDEADLMPFPVLDACYALFVGEKMRPMEVYQILRGMWSDDELKALRSDYSRGMLKQWVSKFVRLFRASIFKWVQAPQAVHLGSLDLDRERALQLPVVQSSEWLLLEELDSILD